MTPDGLLRLVSTPSVTHRVKRVELSKRGAALLREVSGRESWYPIETSAPTLQAKRPGFLGTLAGFDIFENDAIEPAMVRLVWVPRAEVAL